MENCKYLIVGGGMTADAAARGIRASDKSGTIVMLAAEQHAPYDRPPLSKKLWHGKPLDSIWRKTAEAGVDLRLHTVATDADAAKKTVTDDRGRTYSYEKLLLATGGTPRRLPGAHAEVIYFRTLDDYQRLRQLAMPGATAAVIGGGFIGSEIAAALTMNGCRVTMIFPDRALGAHVYPAALSGFITGYYRDKGVTLRAGETVQTIEKSGTKYIVKTDRGEPVTADAVVAGIGIEPDVTLARRLGVQVDNGVVVDEFLRATQPDVYAAGDVANFHNPALDRRLRVEHEDNANTMGAMAGRNMAGGEERYRHLPFFYSDLFDLGYEAVGTLDARLDVVEDWKEPFREGVVYYMKDGRVRGVLLWNVWGQVDAARALIGTPDRFTPASLKQRIVG
jgi:3-phenylpropionate/trans-cinnamate dioxygenase ferredoxin reductase component